MGSQRWPSSGKGHPGVRTRRIITFIYERFFKSRSLIQLRDYLQINNFILEMKNSIQSLEPFYISLLSSIDGNYRVITPIFKRYGNLPLFLDNYALFSLPLIFTNILYTYTLRYIIYLGEPSGNIISNYHGTFIHIYMHWYDPIFKIYKWNSRFSSINLAIFFVLSILLPTPPGISPPGTVSGLHVYVYKCAIVIWNYITRWFS